MTFDPWRGVRASQRVRLAIAAFLVVAMTALGLVAWLAPDLLRPSSLAILLLAAVAAYAAWRWSRDRL